MRARAFLVALAIVGCSPKSVEPANVIVGSRVSSQSCRFGIIATNKQFVVFETELQSMPTTGSKLSGDDLDVLAPHMVTNESNGAKISIISIAKFDSNSGALNEMVRQGCSNF